MIFASLPLAFLGSATSWTGFTWISVSPRNHWHPESERITKVELLVSIFHGTDFSITISRHVPYSVMLLRISCEKNASAFFDPTRVSNLKPLEQESHALTVRPTKVLDWFHHKILIYTKRLIQIIWTCSLIWFLWKRPYSV